MKKVAILIILIMASGLSMYGQNSYKVTSLVKLSDIKEKNLQRVFYVFSKNEFLKLPINYDISFFVYQDNNSISRDDFEHTRAVTQGTSYRISNSPFYANLDKRDKRPPIETVLSLIEDTNGKYIMGIVRTWSALHDMDKHWLHSILQEQSLTTFPFVNGLEHAAKLEPWKHKSIKILR